jgi:O-antigen ligase
MTGLSQMVQLKKAITDTQISKRFPFGLAAVELVAVLSTAVHPLAPLFFLFTAVSTLALIYYQQILLVLFATVGLVKGALIAQFPLFETMDYTVILAALLVIAIARILLISQVKSQIITNQKIIALYAIWVVWMVVCSLYAPDKQLALEKSFRFAFFNSILFVGPIVFIRSRQDSRRVLNAFISIAIVGSIILGGQLIFHLTGTESPMNVTRLTVLSANPIAVARVLSISAGMATLALVMNPGRIWAWGSVLFVCLTGAIFTGSRGPFLSYLIGTFMMGILMGPQARRRIGLVSLLILPLLVLVFLLAPESLTSRFMYLGSMNELAVGKQGFQAVNTIVARVELWRMAIILWTQNISNFFVGVGTAGYRVIFPWRGVAYPHNMILEVLAEFGLLGMGVIGLHLWVLLKKASASFSLWIKSREELFWAVGAVIMFLASMVSGDLNDNRMLWFFLGGFLATSTLGEPILVRSEGN